MTFLAQGKKKASPELEAPNGRRLKYKRCYALKKGASCSGGCGNSIAKPRLLRPGGNLPSHRYLTHCSYSQQHHFVVFIVPPFSENASIISEIYAKIPFFLAPKKKNSRSDKQLFFLLNLQNDGLCPLFTLRGFLQD